MIVPTKIRCHDWVNVQKGASAKNKNDNAMPNVIVVISHRLPNLSARKPPGTATSAMAKKLANPIIPKAMGKVFPPSAYTYCW